MPYNGSGTFAPFYDWTDDDAAGGNVDPVKFDIQDNDFAAGLTNALCRDGQSSPTANINFASYKITSLGTPTANGDAANKSYVDTTVGNNISDLFKTTSGGSSSDYTISPATADESTPQTGEIFGFIANHTSDDVCTLNVSATGAKKWLDTDQSTQLDSGQVREGYLYIVKYDSTLDSGTGAWYTLWSTEAAAPNTFLDAAYQRIDGTNAGPLAGFRNYLMNGAFQLNQRAFAGGSLSAGNYGFDRWKAGSGGASLGVSGYTVTLTSGSIVQVIEAPDLAGKTVTLSVQDPSGSVGVDIEGETGTIASGSGRQSVTVTVPSGSTGNITVELSGTAVTFSRVQLEIGSQPSAFEWRPAAAELALCQRYFCTVITHARGYQQAGQSLVSMIFWPVGMRATPSTTYTAGTTANTSSDTIDSVNARGARHTIAATASGTVSSLSGVVEADAEL